MTDKFGWARSLLYLALLLLMSYYANAQGGVYQTQAFGLSQSGLVVPINGGTFQVCAYSATNVCTVALTNTVFSNKALTIAQANPFITDNLGNANFYAAPGYYTCLISGPNGSGIGSYAFPCLVPPDAGNVVQTVSNQTILPFADATYDLGSAILRWRNGFFSSTVSIGNLLKFGVGDVGVSRTNTDELSFGNGTQGDITASLKSQTLTTVSNITSTAGNITATAGGITAGLVVSSPIFQTTTANPASIGITRLATGDQHCWRNNANSGEVCLSHTSSDRPQWANNTPLKTQFLDGQAYFSAFCTGVATASQTLYLFGLGTNAVITCTQTVATPIGAVITTPGTLMNLRAMSQTGGVNASSGFVRVIKNGVGTSLSCTIGVGTSCNDTAIADYVTVIAGDTVTILFTTQGGETLSNISAAFEKN